MSGFTGADVPDLAGRCIYVTGADSGIGFEAVKVLAARGARVILGCRDEALARAAMARVRETAPHADLSFVAIDLADLDAVRRGAASLADEPIDVLVNNAGLMVPQLQRTAQGHELHFGVNYLAGFVLSGLLLPQLAKRPDPRIIITSSFAHRAERMPWDDLSAEAGYNWWKRYGISKLACLLFLLEFDLRLKASGSPVKAIGCHPGSSITGIIRHYPWPIPQIAPIARHVLNPPPRAAWPVLQAATDPRAEAGGYYGPLGLGEVRGRSGPATRKPHALDPLDAARLWALAVAATGIDPVALTMPGIA